MDLSNLSTQEVGLLAVGATLIAAAVAATSALVSTFVSGWNGRRLAREAATREYRLRMMTPALAEAEQRMRDINAIFHKGKSPTILYSHGEDPGDRKVFATPSDELHEAARRFAKWDHWCWSILETHKGTPPSDEQMKWLLDRLSWSAFVFREAAENFIFGGRIGHRTRQRHAQRDELEEPLLLQLLVDIGHRPTLFGRSGEAAGTGTEPAPAAPTTAS